MVRPASEGSAGSSRQCSRRLRRMVEATVSGSSRNNVCRVRSEMCWDAAIAAGRSSGFARCWSMNAPMRVRRAAARVSAGRSRSRPRRAARTVWREPRRCRRARPTRRSRRSGPRPAGRTDSCGAGRPSRPGRAAVRPTARPRARRPTAGRYGSAGAASARPARRPQGNRTPGGGTSRTAPCPRGRGRPPGAVAPAGARRRARRRSSRPRCRTGVSVAGSAGRSSRRTRRRPPGSEGVPRIPRARGHHRRATGQGGRRNRGAKRLLHAHDYPRSQRSSPSEFPAGSPHRSAWGTRRSDRR